MPGLFNSPRLAGALAVGLLLSGAWHLQSLAQIPGLPATPSSEPTTITNLAQLTGAFGPEERVYCAVRLNLVVCAASQPERGVVVVQDGTGVELLQLGHLRERLLPGQRIGIEGTRLLLRRRDLGTQLSTAPLVDDDGLHRATTVVGEVSLKAGRVPLELDWFNGFRNFALDISCQPPGGQPGRVPDSALWHARNGESAGETNLLPGLRAECYQGYWEQVPDFDLLRPVRLGTTTNFDLAFRTQDELVGVRFRGFFEAPADGRYSFRVTSDDGSLLFIGFPEVAIRRLGATEPPAPQLGSPGQPMAHLGERRWLAVAGRVGFASARDAGLELELRSGLDTVLVKVADASGVDPDKLLNNYVRAVGVGHAALSASGRIVLDRLCVASGAELRSLEPETTVPGDLTLPMDIAKVQNLQINQAILELPVRVRGVVTAANRSDHWLSLQDDTRGIFVDLHSVSNALPVSGEVWEVVGHTAIGNFAPTVVAKELKRLGHGRLPEPAHASWNELANGSMDVQRVEFQGLVSGVQSNVLTLLLAAGPLEVSMENYFEDELKRFQHAVVRIRGTLVAVWNADTREVQFGSVVMRNASLNVDIPPPLDPFDAPLKSARDLLKFDAEATAFRPVKVRAQVLYAEPQRIFVAQEGLGLRLLAASSIEVRPGDWVEAVGYPEISGPSPLLRQALLRKTGTAPLPAPRVLGVPELPRKGLDSTLVRVKAKLMSTHSEQNSPVLELQAGGELFVARLRPATNPLLSLRNGSLLELSGVYVETGPNRRLESHSGPFELLLNSPADIRVLSEPSWWTLERLGAMVGFLTFVLVLAAVWITQLRRQVEQRTAQLQREIRERERAEHHRALEEERSRIARDLHDDLGSSLTEIGVLANTGQRANAAPDGSAGLFDAIAGKARGSIAALDVIVWAVDPEDNSLQSLADYLSGFAGEYLSHSHVACRFKIPVAFPAVMLEGRIRHDLFLAVKETLNNVVRHAQATEVEFRIVVSKEDLEIVIADNGRGFDTAALQDGNGLKNLRGRMAKLGGAFSVESRSGGGTTVQIRLPLAAPQECPTAETV